MGAGNLIGIVLGAGTLIGVAYAGSRLLAAVAANKYPPLAVFGDFPHVPDELKAAVQKARLGGGSGLGQRPSVTNKQNNQTTNSKPPIQSGQVAK